MLETVDSKGVRFQFHYGSVKRGSQAHRKPSNLSFQFHYGSVKRVDSIAGDEGFLDFNSTMVRLKGRARSQK